MKAIRTFAIAAGAAVAMLPLVGLAQQGDLTHSQEAVHSAAVDFGVLPTAPLGPPPCAQVPPFGAPTDPCGFKLHHLIPEEVTVFKDGQVTFQIHGGGHAMAIYEVSKDTTRDQIGQFLCAGVDVTTLDDPALHPCLGSAVNANAPRDITDGHNDVVITVAAGAATHPGNRVWSEPGRLMSAGALQFLNGGTIPAGPTSNGQLVTYQFLKTGRYLVICANRFHLLNDWMFGFVNVVGGE